MALLTTEIKVTELDFFRELLGIIENNFDDLPESVKQEFMDFKNKLDNQE